MTIKIGKLHSSRLMKAGFTRIILSYQKHQGNEFCNWNFFVGNYLDCVGNYVDCVDYLVALEKVKKKETVWRSPHHKRIVSS